MFKKIIENLTLKYKSHGEINKDHVKSFFNRTKNLMFSADSAEAEQKVILREISSVKNKRVLDLGCGNGRYSTLIPDVLFYHGVDFSGSFIADCQPSSNVKFTEADIVEFVGDQTSDKYNIILLVGVITYLEDEDIKKLLDNILNMLLEDAIIVLRSVTLRKLGKVKLYYDSNEWLLNKLRFTKPHYQTIRRSMEYELDLFSKFSLLRTVDVPNTSYTVYIFNK